MLCDISGSMGSPRSKLKSATRATAVAIDCIRDGVLFGVIAGNDTARAVYPLEGALIPASPQTRQEAKRAVERLKASGKLLSRLVPQDVGALARRHELLQAELKTNLVVLATAHAVSEGIIRRLSGDLVRKSCPQVYGASGRATAPDPKRAQPLAFSRTM